MWKIILILLSQVIFFTFVMMCLIEFNLLSCYSAYAPEWKKKYPIKNMNWWSLVTILTAVLLMPVMIDLRNGTPLQFLGFLIPVFIVMVGVTPDYKENKGHNVVHQIGAWGSVVMLILYLIYVPKMLILVVFYLLFALFMIFIYPAKKDTWTFWLEMAVYQSIYTVMLWLSIMLLQVSQVE